MSKLLCSDTADTPGLVFHPYKNLIRQWLEPNILFGFRFGFGKKNSDSDSGYKKKCAAPAQIKMHAVSMMKFVAGEKLEHILSIILPFGFLKFKFLTLAM
jgi:hypothetical protein